MNVTDLSISNLKNIFMPCLDPWQPGMNTKKKLDVKCLVNSMKTNSVNSVNDTFFFRSKRKLKPLLFLVGFQNRFKKAVKNFYSGESSTANR